MPAQYLPTQESSAVSGSRIPRAVWIFLLISGCLTALNAWFTLRIPGFAPLVRLHFWPYPHVAPDQYTDFYPYKARYALFHSAKFFESKDWPFNYPAPLAVVSRILYVPQNSTGIFLRGIIVCFMIASVLVGRALLKRRVPLQQIAVLLALGMSFAWAWDILFERANLEIVVWVFTVAGLYAFFARRDNVAASCFGLAASLKFYPIILLALFVSAKRYRQVVLGIVVAIASTIVSLWLLCPQLGASIRGVRAGLQNFNNYFVLHFHGVGFDHSIFAGLKMALLHVSIPATPETVAAMLRIYLPVMAVLGTSLYFKLARHLPVTNQVLFLLAAAVLIPPVSYDYTLIELYAPLVMLILFAVELCGKKAPGLMAAMICLAIALSPENALPIPKHPIGGQIKCLALLILVVIALRYPFPSSFDEVLSKGHSGRRLTTTNA